MLLNGGSIAGACRLRALRQHSEAMLGAYEERIFRACMGHYGAHSC